MPPEVELAQQWLARARSDLRAAELLLADEPPLCEDAGFHAQQAIEKALKGFLVYRQIPFERSHQLAYLLDLCAAKDDPFEQFRFPVVPLTEYAVRFCYPHPDPPPSEGRVRRALEIARQVYTFVLGRLPEESHPPA